MTFHRITVQLLDSDHNKAAIDSLMHRLPGLLGPVHGPFEVIKQEKIEVVGLSTIEPRTPKP